MLLKQIAVINAGYPFRGRIPEQADSSVLAVQMRDVSLVGGIAWSECVPAKLTGKRKPDYLAVGDILVAARGSNNYAVQVDDALVESGKQAVAAPHFFVVSLKDKNILPEFLTWLLNQAPAQRHFEQSAEGTLTKSIRRSVLEDAPIIVPSLAKQRMIVAMANTLREEQKLMQQLIINGERMMSGLANELYNKEVSQ